jgi:hypothetical protein
MGYLVQHFAQPLHLIEQDVPLSDHGLVLSIFDRRTCRYYDALDLVNCAMQTAICYEAREFAVDKR